MNFRTQGQAIKTKRTYTPRVYQAGNFCGHNPDAPAFRAVLNRCQEKAKHPLIRTAIKALGSYYANPDILDKLGRILSNGDQRKRRKDGAPRQVRSEGRDAAIMVMAYCLSRINLFRLQVGIVPYSNPDTIYSPTEIEIAEELGLSLGRVQKALARWKHAGYISITQRPRKNVDGKWESISPIICIRQTVLVLIGISKRWLKKCQEYQYKKWKSERERRFRRAVERERELQQAKSQEARDFIAHDLMSRIDELRANQKEWRKRTDPPDPPDSILTAH